MRKKKTLPLLSYGFSLMEMMVVLLIVAIIAAASAPMVTKKMARNAGTADSPWVYTGLSNNIAYLGGGNGQVLIGSATRPANAEKATVYIAGRSGWAHIGYGNEDNTSASYITYQAANNANGLTRIGLTNIAQVPNNSVMLGGNQTATTGTGIIALGHTTTTNATGAIAIGSNTVVTGTRSLAIGSDAAANSVESVAVGHNAKAVPSAEGSVVYHSIAIGEEATAYDSSATAIGPNTTAGQQGTAIGSEAKSEHFGSTAIGYKAVTTQNNQIVLGDENTIVYIPGQLWVDGTTVLSRQRGNTVVRGSRWQKNSESSQLFTFLSSDGDDAIDYDNLRTVRQSNTNLQLEWNSSSKNQWNKAGQFQISDERLKNVSKVYTSSLEELKQLEFFHYTFKDDKTKTPRVGVIAQDLQKVFPDAVTKGDDGFLRIRWEDMFYAVINAVKDLDKKISAVIADITGMQDTIKTQQAQIEELEKRLKKLETRRFKNDEQ